MDISMPGIDGIEATCMIRASEGESRSTPIVGLTAHALPAEQERFAEAGMQDCLIKPIRLAKLQGFLSEFEPTSDGAGEELTRAASPVTPTPERPYLIDEETLSDLATALSEDVLARTLERFSEEIDPLPEFHKALAEEDLETLGKQAHRLAGSAAIVGAARMHAILCDIATECHAGNLGAARDLIDEELVTAARETGETLAKIGRPVRGGDDSERPRKSG